MGIFKGVNAKVKTEKNTGFGTNANSYGGRFINKNGSANVEKIGLNQFRRISWFHTMVALPAWKFLCVIFAFYFCINLIFASLYYAVGIEHLNGINTDDSQWEVFGQAYFFSAQTFTTVGYGHISPVGFLTSSLSAIEALIGLLSFAIATGLLFGRFSKPTAFLKFSHNALIGPYGENTGLMIRTTPFKNTNFTDAEAKITLGMSVDVEGVITNKFYTLELEMDKVNALTLSWTLVHPITEDSPLFGMNKVDFSKIKGEILVFIKTFDQMYSNTVAISTSYTFNEVVYGAKFNTMFKQSDDQTKTILDLDKLNSFEYISI